MNNSSPIGSAMARKDNPTRSRLTSTALRAEQAPSQPLPICGRRGASRWSASLSGRGPLPNPSPSADGEGLPAGRLRLRDEDPSPTPPHLRMERGFPLVGFAFGTTFHPEPARHVPASDRCHAVSLPREERRVLYHPTVQFRDLYKRLTPLSAAAGGGWGRGRPPARSRINRPSPSFRSRADSSPRLSSIASIDSNGD